MVCTLWGSNRDPNFDLWDEAYWVIAQWLCQLRARIDDAGATHIDNPALHNNPCNWCFDQSYSLIDEGLGELLQAFASAAYDCGTAGVSEHEAVRRSLRAMIDRATAIERTKELLAGL